MSSFDLISATNGTRVHQWIPVRPGPHTRVVYLEDALYGEITLGTDHRIGGLWQDLDNFSLGELITVGYGPEATCMMKNLDPRTDEVWEIRSKDPKPQIRIFGRFCAQDVFVATHATYRDHLGNPWESKFEGNHWPQEILRCRQIWEQLCQGAAPHNGRSINDYISANVVEVGKLA